MIVTGELVLVNAFASRSCSISKSSRAMELQPISVARFSSKGGQAFSEMIMSKQEAGER